jgi:hypothetical protein
MSSQPSASKKKAASVHVVSRGKQIENGSVFSVRQAAAVCNVSPPEVHTYQVASNGRSAPSNAARPGSADTSCPRNAHVSCRRPAVRMAASETWQVNLCIDWPVKPVNPPRIQAGNGEQTLQADQNPIPVGATANADPSPDLGAHSNVLITRRSKTARTLLIHAVHDPSDPYSWTHGLAAQIDGSALLTRTGDGHTSVFTSDCARSAADAFLIDVRSEANRICEG